MFSLRKKILPLIMCLAIMGTSLSPISSTNSDAKKKMTVSDIKAAYVVADADTGEILASHKANKKVYPASTTKVLTICTIMRRMDQKNIHLNDYLKITSKMLKSVPYGSKCAYIRKKKKYTYKDIIGLVMVVSAADAVQALIYGLYSSSSEFITDMNSMAATIGMTKSYFDNGIGLDKSNGFKKIHTTANDMVKLAKYANANCPIINEMSKKKSIRIHDKSKKYYHYFKSTNQFYNGFKYKKSLYKIVGMKTGYTSDAKYTLLTKSQAVGSGRNLLIGVFDIGKKENVYKDTRVLLNYYT